MKLTSRKDRVRQKSVSLWRCYKTNTNQLAKLNFNHPSYNIQKSFAQNYVKNVRVRAQWIKGMTFLKLVELCLNQS